MPDNRAIGIFDSGLGGLTVAGEIIKLLPNEKIVYFGDTARTPYGIKSEKTVYEYAVQDEKFLLSRNVKAVVVACGTASSVAADTAKLLPVPFIEVISHSVNDAVRLTKNKKIGVLATEVTIRSSAHKRKILELLPEAEVVGVAAADLVTLVEEGRTDAQDEYVLETVREYLKPMIEAQVDTVILGCTHFPVLLSAIQKIMGEDVTLINMGVSTAKAVKQTLKDTDALSDREAGEHKFFVSKKTGAFKKTAEKFLGLPINDEAVETVDVSKL